MSPPNLLIVDDDRGFARSLSHLLASEGYRSSTCHDAAGALSLVRSQAFDCALIDYNLGATLGTVLLAQLTDEGHDFPKIILTAYGDARAATQAMKLGAVDFVEKRSRTEELLQAVAAALRQSQFVRTAQDCVREARRALRSLTERESEIVDAIAAGYSNRQIADALAVSPRTVEAHRANALQKLGVTNTAALVRLAVLSGLGLPDA